MSNLNLRSITNSFQDVRLVSLSSWRQANEISPRDRGGPYIVLQEGYDPGDPKLTPDEFVLGRSGKWLPLRVFFRMPVPERRAEFVFGTAAEVMQMMSELPSKAAMLGREEPEPAEGAAAEPDEMAAAFQAAKNRGAGTPPANSK
jgi:hypothetical protein